MVWFTVFHLVLLRRFLCLLVIIWALILSSPLSGCRLTRPSLLGTWESLYFYSRPLLTDFWAFHSSRGCYFLDKLMKIKVCKAFWSQIKNCHPKMQLLWLSSCGIFCLDLKVLCVALNSALFPMPQLMNEKGRYAVLAQAAQKFGSRVEDGEVCKASQVCLEPKYMLWGASLAVQCQNKNRIAYTVQGVQDFSSPTWTLLQPASASITISDISEAISEITGRAEMAKVWAPPHLVCKGVRL